MEEVARAGGVRNVNGASVGTRNRGKSIRILQKRTVYTDVEKSA